ncbi:hypothetical protein ABZY06_22005 [Streptomyces sp. NPDC006540]|jgi:hypothetical protein|uniref:hypothetical protein n=1 Tax=Streptomyces sp. NPDC006540 TaxID=3155353 RepID=UPI0033BC16EF
METSHDDLPRTAAPSRRNANSARSPRRAQALQQTQQQPTRARQQESAPVRNSGAPREKQRQAEELAARVQARVDELADELDRLRTGATDYQADAVLTGDAPGSARVAVSVDSNGDDIDQALVRVAAINDQDVETLRCITDNLAQDPRDERTACAKRPRWWAGSFSSGPTQCASQSMRRR